MAAASLTFRHTVNAVAVVIRPIAFAAERGAVIKTLSVFVARGCPLGAVASSTRTSTQGPLTRFHFKDGH